MREPDVIDRYLPAEFAVLLLWALGYPLDMAWSLAMVDEPAQSAYCKEAMAELDDARLVGELEASATSRGDGSELAFGWLGSTEVLIRL